MGDQLNEFCRQRYDHEAARRGELTSAVALPMGALTVLLGALLALVKDIRDPLQPSDLVLVSSASLSALACGVSAFFLARSFFNYTYRYVATPKAVLDYHREVNAAHKQAGKTQQESIAAADSAATAYIQERYSECAHHNTSNNDRKSFFLHLANGAMIFALLPAAVAGGAFLYNSFNSRPPIARVEITNLKEVLPKERPNDNRNTQGSPGPATSSATQSHASGAAAGPVHKGAP